MNKTSKFDLTLTLLFKVIYKNKKLIPFDNTKKETLKNVCECINSNYHSINNKNKLNIKNNLIYILSNLHKFEKNLNTFKPEKNVKECSILKTNTIIIKKDFHEESRKKENSFLSINNVSYDNLNKFLSHYIIKINDKNDNIYGMSGYINNIKLMHYNTYLSKNFM